MSESFTIQISSDLINRLIDDGEKKKTRKSKPKTPKKHHQPESKVHQKQAPEVNATHKFPPPADVPAWPIPPYLPLPNSVPTKIEDPKLEGIRSVLLESERIIERLEKYEQDKLKEVTEKAKELHEKEFKIPAMKTIPCLAEKDACLSCYKEHLKDPLKCAGTVKSFEECSRRARQQTHS